MKLSKCLNCGASLKINKKLEIKYCEYCGEEYLFEEFLAIEKVFLISSKLASPVEIITGFPNLQIFFTSELSCISNEDIL